MSSSRCAFSSSFSLPLSKDFDICSSGGSIAVCAVRAVSEIMSATKSRSSYEISAVFPSKVIDDTKMQSIVSCTIAPSENVPPARTRWIFQPAHIVAASRGGKG